MGAFLFGLRVFCAKTTKPKRKTRRHCLALVGPRSSRTRFHENGKKRRSPTNTPNRKKPRSPTKISVALVGLRGFGCKLAKPNPALKFFIGLHSCRTSLQRCIAASQNFHSQPVEPNIFRSMRRLGFRDFDKKHKARHKNHEDHHRNRRAQHMKHEAQYKNHEAQYGNHGGQYINHEALHKNHEARH